jgi:hypothetical protein
MKLARVVAIASLLAAPAAAQTPGEVEVSIAGFELAANGAEKPAGVRFTTGPFGLKTGEPASAMFSVTGCGYFALRTGPPFTFADAATAGWRVEITPLKVVDHVVTFRLRWTRALDTSKTFEPPREDIELTLKPGESRPVDSVPVAMANVKTFDGKPCTTKTASLRVSADFPDMDHRLVAADLWLVEKLANGKERVQTQSVRGLFNRAIPFYFDTVTDGTNRVDIFGKLVADSSQGGFEVNIEGIRAVENQEPEWGYWAARWFRSTLHIKPDEVVDVALPPPDIPPGVLSDRSFSIRIKPKQIR